MPTAAKDSARTHYQVLGVTSSATATEIKQARDKLVLQYHPDKNPDDPGATERFKKMQNAYEVLRDTEARAGYDKSLGLSHQTTDPTLAASYTCARQILQFLQQYFEQEAQYFEAFTKGDYSTNIKNAAQAVIAKIRIIQGALEPHVAKDGGEYEGSLLMSIMMLPERLPQVAPHLVSSNSSLSRILSLDYSAELLDAIVGQIMRHDPDTLLALRSAQNALYHLLDSTETPAPTAAAPATATAPIDSQQPPPEQQSRSSGIRGWRLFQFLIKLLQILGMLKKESGSDAAAASAESTSAPGATAAAPSASTPAPVPPAGPGQGARAGHQGRTRAGHPPSRQDTHSTDRAGQDTHLTSNIAMPPGGVRYHQPTPPSP